MKDYHAPFEPHCFYHVYNRANGSENIFREGKNYSFFLKKWNSYIAEYADVWAYCLIPNHFHFLIRVKSQAKDRHAMFLKHGMSVLTYDKLISNQFRKLFISYTKAYNKVYNRNGSLFQKPFKRIKVDSQNYLHMLIHYIHHNPIHHHFVDDYADWSYSSYSAMISEQPTKLQREEVLTFFGGKEAFVEYHSQMKNYNKIDHLVIE